MSSHRQQAPRRNPMHRPNKVFISELYRMTHSDPLRTPGNLGPDASETLRTPLPLPEGTRYAAISPRRCELRSEPSPPPPCDLGLADFLGLRGPGFRRATPKLRSALERGRGAGGARRG